jgi:hypothetical protein
MAEKDNVMFKMLGKGMENYDENVSTSNCIKWFVESQLIKNLQNYIKFLMDHLTRMYQTMETKTIFVKQAKKEKKCWKAHTKMASSSRDESEGTQAKRK